MSSRVLFPDDPRAVSAVSWRESRAAGQPAPGTPAGTSSGAPRDSDAGHRAQLAELDRQWQEKLRQARAAGVAEGEAAGKKRAAAEVQPVLDKLSQTMAETAGLRARLRREAEADMLKLALAIARRVLRRELAVDPEALHGLVLAAFEKLEGQEICRLRVHPAHSAAVAGLLGRTAAAAAVPVTPDGTLQPGAVVFETPRGNLDASIETQLQEIERGLADCLRRRS